MPQQAHILPDKPLIILSNREPYEHVHGPQVIEVRAPAGGLVSALDPILRRTRGTWVAWASGSYARNFMDCVARGLPEAQVHADGNVIDFAGRQTHVGAFPISIDVAEWARLSQLPSTLEMALTLRERFAPSDRQLVVSVDRMDYTKGIVRRLRALEQMWLEHPERRGTFTMLIVATPSRTDIPAYARLEHEVLDAVGRLNDEFRTLDWTPIVLVHDNIDADLLAAVYRAADVCVVSSLQDGMNLVAKEFIACRGDGAGVLVLSRFAGAADELNAALLVNPFFIDAFADGLATALDMPPEERKARMTLLRHRVINATIGDWLDGILEAAESLAHGTETDAVP